MSINCNGMLLAYVLTFINFVNHTKKLVWIESIVVTGFDDTSFIITSQSFYSNANNGFHQIYEWTNKF